MIEDRPLKQEEPGGAWITTFADLMSLLMCFFVLLLSFVELDIMKFKAVAGSIKLAFGVQREIKAIEVPKGTSIVAQEFSAAAPDPGAINEIRQQTTDEDKQTLEFTDALVNETEGEDPEDWDGGQPEQFEETEADAQRLVEALKNEIEEGMIQIETQSDSIVIRIREKGSFPSGTALFDPAFQQVLNKLGDAMQDVEGTIAVAGHTDDIPISTSLYRSNWDLSSARAVSVVHALLEGGTLDVARLVVEGHGDAHPLVPKDMSENRAQNRRVEVTIRQSQIELDSVEEAMAAYAASESREVRASPRQEPESALDEPAESTAQEPVPEQPKSRIDLIREEIEGA